MNKPITISIRKSLIVVAFPLAFLSSNVQAHSYIDWLLPDYFWIEQSYHIHDGHHYHRHHHPRHVRNHHFKPYVKHRSKHHRHHTRHHHPRHHGQFHHRDEKRIIKKHSR